MLLDITLEILPTFEGLESVAMGKQVLTLTQVQDLHCRVVLLATNISNS